MADWIQTLIFAPCRLHTLPPPPTFRRPPATGSAGPGWKQRGRWPQLRAEPTPRPSPRIPLDVCLWALPSPSPLPPRGCGAAGQRGPLPANTTLYRPRRPLPARLGGDRTGAHAGSPPAPRATPDRCGASSPAMQAAAKPGLASPRMADEERNAKLLCPWMGLSREL